MAKLFYYVNRKSVFKTYNKKFTYCKRNGRCKALYMSERAYSSILSETRDKDPLETGGVLLGHVKDGIYYIVEAIGPGMDTYHTLTRHKMDNQYQNHEYSYLSGIYEEGLEFIGLWHRHPGTFNIFSDIDHVTNDKFAKAIGDYAISLIINFIPSMKISAYFLDKKNNSTYYTVPLLVGDGLFEDTNYLKYVKEEKNEERN